MSWNGLAVGLIPDGNRRWAEIHEKPLHDAYTVAAQRTAEAVLALRDRGVHDLLIYGASAGNVRYRDPRTLSILVEAFVDTFQSSLHGPGQTGVQLSVVGDLSPLQLWAVREFDRINRFHDPHGEMNCVIVFNYSVEWDLSQGLESASDSTPLTASNLLANLPSRHLPHLDLVIRTAGEKRLSGFLPLQTTYSELFFLDTLWPDFTISQLDAVIVDFHQRKRTFGR